MNNRYAPLALSLFAFTLLNSAFANVAPAMADWEEVHSDELCTVYKKEMPGSDILAMKGVSTLEAPMGKLLGVVLDVEHRADWMEQVKSSEVIRQVSPMERVEYFHLSPPWPIRDRDLVVNEKIEIDRAAHTITVRMKSVEDPLRPVRDDRIRAELMDASFVAKPSADGQHTEMVAESHADPKGSIPKFIVNIYQKSMPSKTLGRLLKRTREDGVTESPLARELQ